MKMKNTVKLLVMDVDGTLTDGRIFIGPDGEVMKAFDVKDGFGIVRFRQAGGIPAVVTGRQSEIVEERCRELGITELMQGVGNKLDCLMQLAEKYHLEREQIAYIGDDLSDLDAIQYAGISACPADAVEAVRGTSTYVCRAPGGFGAVREFLDELMKDEQKA